MEISSTDVVAELSDSQLRPLLVKLLYHIPSAIDLVGRVFEQSPRDQAKTMAAKRSTVLRFDDVSEAIRNYLINDDTPADTVVSNLENGVFRILKEC